MTTSKRELALSDFRSEYEAVSKRIEEAQAAGETEFKWRVNGNELAIKPVSDWVSWRNLLDMSIKHFDDVIDIPE